MIFSVTSEEKALLAGSLPMDIQTGQPILQVRHLSIIFPDGNSGLKALDDISFAVNPEQFVCVLGPSGCGKTTLLRTLAGLLAPTNGEVIFENSSLYNPQAWGRHGLSKSQPDALANRVGKYSPTPGNSKPTASRGNGKSTGFSRAGWFDRI